MKVLLKRFHLNGHTIGFHPQTKKLELRTKQIAKHHVKVLLKRFHFNGHTLGFHPQTKCYNYVQNKWSHYMNSSTESKARTTH